MVLAGLRQPDDRHQLRRRVRRRVPQGREELRRQVGLRRGAEGRDGDPAEQRGRPQGRGPGRSSSGYTPNSADHGVLVVDRGLRQRLRHREPVEEALRRSSRERPAQAGVPGELRVLHQPGPAVREHVRPERRVLPGPGRRRQVQPLAAGLRPAGVGQRLHRDRRLGHGVLRAAGRSGPGQPLRRQGGPGEEAGHVLRRPGDGELPRLLRRRRSTRCGRRGTCGWASSATPTRPRTTRSTCTTTPVSRRRRRRRSARRSRGSTPAARSGRVTRATRTTASSRPGGPSARWASTRCRWAARTTRSGRRCSRRRRSTWPAARTW